MCRDINFQAELLCISDIVVQLNILAGWQKHGFKHKQHRWENQSIEKLLHGTLFLDNVLKILMGFVLLFFFMHD